MILFSGARIEPLLKFGGKYSDTALTIPDIALALGRIPRFGGHTRRWWPGILHAFVCVRLAMLLGMPRRIQLLALLHDAHEAVTGDVPAFFKTPSMSVMQDHIDELTFTGMGLWPIADGERSNIKLLDDLSLKAEAFVVGPPGIMCHLAPPSPEAVKIVQDIADAFPTPASTDGLESPAAQEFYRTYAALIGAAVHSRNDHTPNNGD